MSDTHYSYQPGTLGWVIREQFPAMPVADVDRLADAIDELRPESPDPDDEDSEFNRGYAAAIDDVRGAISGL